MITKTPVGHNAQLRKMNGDLGGDKELKDWILAETKSADAADAGRALERARTTTARIGKENTLDLHGIQTWMSDTRSSADRPGHLVAGSPYSQASFSTNPLFVTHKSMRKGLPVEFPGQHRELDLVPGSVFLVDSKGSFLKLPIPSNMPEDPLRWCYWKKTGAVACLLFFSMLSISSCQLPEVNYQFLLRDPDMQVSGHSAGSLSEDFGNHSALFADNLIQRVRALFQSLCSNSLYSPRFSLDWAPSFGRRCPLRLAAVLFCSSVSSSKLLAALSLLPQRTSMHF